MGSNEAIQNMLGKAVEGMTGVQVDLVTVCISMIVIGVIVIGLHVIVNSITMSLRERYLEDDFETAADLSEDMDNPLKSKFERDVARVKYRRLVTKHSRY